MCVLTLTEAPVKVTKAAAVGKEAVANIDDFVPDEEIDTNFLTEEADEEHNKLFNKERLLHNYASINCTSFLPLFKM